MDRGCSKCGRPVKARGMCSTHVNAFRRRQIAYGKWDSYVDLVDAAPVKDHLRKLSVAGIGQKQVAALSGLSRGTVDRVLYHGQRCASATAEAILAVPFPEHPHGGELADGAHVPALGTVRRLRALARAGFSVQFLADEWGVPSQQVSRMRRYPEGRVAASTARRVEETFLRLQMDAGPSRETARRAAVQGWPPPLAWDEDTIDDPAAKPAEAYRRRTKDFPDEYREMREFGWSDDKIADHLGVTKDAVLVRLRRYERRQEAAA